MLTNSEYIYHKLDYKYLTQYCDCKIFFVGSHLCKVLCSSCSAFYRFTVPDIMFRVLPFRDVHFRGELQHVGHVGEEEIKR